MLDSHAHYKTFEDLEWAQACGVTRAWMVGATLEDAEFLFRASEKYKEQESFKITSYIGIHPWEVDSSFDSAEIFGQKRAGLLAAMNRFQKAGLSLGIGELGLDYAKDRIQVAAAQKKVCELQIRLALDHGLPIQAHVVGGHGDFLKIWDACVALQRATNKTPPSRLVHAWSGAPALAKEYVRRGFRLGIGGLVLDPKNSQLQECVKIMPLGAFRIESEWPGRPLQLEILDEIIQFLCKTKDVKKSNLIEVTQS